ncbi:uncharacterized protein BDR25DRAFT_396498 [Lindgomyces ingoldianus]|uniref:Uncharacterized protein n=1 Tax=Lindgomyces ingoldianus TaxID=673940 RepID=A0ACB6QE07_9PLEO|nr:uncharacterized protein BDR25DRAFT_396498 [Lindgomyces ingoldianus]KAF2464843.1 hypothetical protein BDR25DRAFT_396498 [Lindgomyces ingoldianus]
MTATPSLLIASPKTLTTVTIPMPVTAEYLEAFAPIKWAIPILKSPGWISRPRGRDTEPDDNADRFCRDTIRSYDGTQQWLELYQKPAAETKTVMKTLSLCKYGTGLSGFPGICHGGAVMTLMDEALAFAMVANETESRGAWVGVDLKLKELHETGRPLTEVLKGYMVTAKLDMKFLKPVLCPGVVGIEVEMVEKKGHKMRMRGVMRDGDGVPLVQAEGCKECVLGCRSAEVTVISSFKSKTQGLKSPTCSTSGDADAAQCLQEPYPFEQLCEHVAGRRAGFKDMLNILAKLDSPKLPFAYSLYGNGVARIRRIYLRHFIEKLLNPKSFISNPNLAQPLCLASFLVSEIERVESVRFRAEKEDNSARTNTASNGTVYTHHLEWTAD